MAVAGEDALTTPTTTSVAAMVTRVFMGATLDPLERGTQSVIGRPHGVAHLSEMTSSAHRVQAQLTLVPESDGGVPRPLVSPNGRLAVHLSDPDDQAEYITLGAECTLERETYAGAEVSLLFWLDLAPVIACPGSSFRVWLAPRLPPSAPARRGTL